MENIFKTAKFGAIYKTRDGRKAVYLNHFYEEFRCFEQNGINHKLWVQECNQPIWYKDNGTADCPNRGFDVLSAWREEINEEELVDTALTSAIEYNKEIDNTMTTDQEYWYQEGFKVGYRTAKEG